MSQRETGRTFLPVWTPRPALRSRQLVLFACRHRGTAPEKLVHPKPYPPNAVGRPRRFAENASQPGAEPQPSSSADDGPLYGTWVLQSPRLDVSQGWKNYSSQVHPLAFPYLFAKSMPSVLGFKGVNVVGFGAGFSWICRVPYSGQSDPVKPRPGVVTMT